MSRNAIKFRAFIPQEGYYEYMAQREKEREKISKPVLSPDDEERINSVIIDSLNYGEVVEIITIKNGFKQIIQGIIEECRMDHKYITMYDGTRVLINDIIDAKKL